MPSLASNKICTGCSSCANACAYHAIEMRADAEGFLQPHIDAEKCVKCGLCEKKCPVVNPVGKQGMSQKAYAVICYEDKKKSSSGGAFSMFARYVLQNKGIIYGAAMDEDLQVSHIRVDNLDGLEKLRGSKYVQSCMGNSYTEAKNDLKNGKTVLFTGTPCQIAGLYKYLGKKYEGQLITLDLVCHGVPNQQVFDSYIEKLKKSTRPKAGSMNIEGVRFRKLDSWDYRPAVKFTESNWKILTQESNSYMSAFFRAYTYRESCYHCQYANLERNGTFTIADFWGIGRHGKSFSKNVSSGVSLVIDNCGMMTELMPQLSKWAYIEERSIEEAIAENQNLKMPMKRPAERDTAIRDMLDMDVNLLEYAEKYRLKKKENAKYYISKLTKDLIYALGLYNVYKSISYKMGK